MAIRHDSATLDPDAGVGPPPWVLGPDGEIRLDKAQVPGDAAPDHFAVLGLPRRLLLDPRHVEIRTRSLIRALHPDRFHVQGPTAVAHAQAHTSRVNDAFRILRDLERRVAYVLDLAGEKPDEKFRPPAELLGQVFEWNEAVDALQEALAEGDPAAVTGARAQVQVALADLGHRRQAVTQDVETAAAAWDAAQAPNPPLAAAAAARKALRAALGYASYLDNLLARLEATLHQGAQRL